MGLGKGEGEGERKDGLIAGMDGGMRMVWCGMVCYGMVWYGVVCYGKLELGVGG